MPERDPRTNPVPGDILRRLVVGGWVDVRVDHVTPEWVYCAKRRSGDDEHAAALIRVTPAEWHAETNRLAVTVVERGRDA